MAQHQHIRTIRPSVVAHVVGALPLAVVWIAALVFVQVQFKDYAKFALAAFGVWILWRLLKIVGVLIGASYTVYSDVIVSRVGVIARSVAQVRVADIRGMSLRQSIVGRILNYGDVVVGTAATADAEIVMRSVPSPSEVIASIDALRS